MVLIGNIFLTLTVIIEFFGWFRETKKDIVVVQVIGNILDMIGYTCLWALNGVMNSLVSLTCNLLFIHKEKSNKAIIVITSIKVILTIITWESWITGFNIIRIITETYGLLKLNNRKYKSLSAFCQAEWLIYDTYNKAYGASVGDVFIILAIIYSLYKTKRQAE